MGNSCCTSRLHVKSVSMGNTESLPLEIDEKIDKVFRKKSDIAVLNRGVPVGIGVDNKEPDEKSYIEELDYNFPKVSETHEKKMNKIFGMYKNTIPVGETEFVAGVIFVEFVESPMQAIFKWVVLSNFAIYIILQGQEFALERRIKYKNLIILLISEDLNNMILHMTCNELLGDLWIRSKQCESIHNCIQIHYRQFSHNYIPTSTLESLSFASSFNNLPFSLIKTLLTEKQVKISKVVISKGKFGENILIFQSGFAVIRKILINCILVVTNLALYTLEENYKFIHRDEFKCFSSLLVSKDFQKMILVLTNGGRVFYLVPENFVGAIQKNYLKVAQMKLKVNVIDGLDVDEYVDEVPCFT